MGVLSEIEKQRKSVRNPFDNTDKDYVPFELVRPLVEKLEKENAELKEYLAGARSLVKPLLKENADLKQQLTDKEIELETAVDNEISANELTLKKINELVGFRAKIREHYNWISINLISPEAIRKSKKNMKELFAEELK